MAVRTVVRGLVLAAALLLVPSCGAETSSTTAPFDVIESGGLDVLVEPPSPTRVINQARASGMVAPVGRGRCLGLTGAGEDFLLVWPPEASVSTTGSTSVTSAERTFALGQEVVLGGGFIVEQGDDTADARETRHIVDELLPESCRGMSVWVIGDF